LDQQSVRVNEPESLFEDSGRALSHASPVLPRPLLPEA
jgi:hypothetical protein